MTTVYEDEWKKYQLENAQKIIIIDDFDMSKVQYIAGLDISFDKKNSSRACAYVTIYDVISDKIVYEDHNVFILTVPYISGFLGFREIPQYKLLLNKLHDTKPEFYPHILMIDGFGILHHRGFGSASHLGYEMGIPSIGVAKTLLVLDGLDEKITKTKFKTECKNKGDYINLIGTSGKIHGVALKSAQSVENPLFVSIGHKISLESAVKLVIASSKFRIPEPIRNSDIKSKLYFG